MRDAVLAAKCPHHRPEAGSGDQSSLEEDERARKGSGMAERPLLAVGDALRAVGANNEALFWFAAVSEAYFHSGYSAGRLLSMLTATGQLIDARATMALLEVIPPARDSTDVLELRTSSPLPGGGPPQER